MKQEENYKYKNYKYYDLSNDLNSSIESEEKLIDEANIFFLQTSSTRTRETICKRCDKQFLLRNRLHYYIRLCKIKKFITKVYYDKIITFIIYYNKSKVLYFDASSK